MALTLTQTLNLALNLNPDQFICNPMVNPLFSTFSALISSNFCPCMKNRNETSHTGAPLTQCMVIGTGNLEPMTPEKDRAAGGIQSLDHKVQ